MEDKKTSVNLDQNICALLGYLFGWISGLIFFLLEKENKFVRFHALQSIILSAIPTAISIILGWIPIIGWLVSTVCWILFAVCWIICMVKSYQNEWFKLPVIGDIAAKQVGADI